MAQELRLEYHRTPSALRYMAGPLWPKPGARDGASVPSIAARWRGYRARDRDVADFCALAGVWPGDALSLLFPHAIGFRLALAILCHPRFPVPIWRVLFVRAHLLQHRPIPRGAVLDFDARIAGHRVLEKGLEVDVRTTVGFDVGDVSWESLDTFYARGSFGAPAAEASPLAEAPSVASDNETRWRMPERGGRRFAELTGDYNPLHLWTRYARRAGFPAAFLHAQRALGYCITHPHAPTPDEPQRLDAWIKGPVPYGADVTLRARGEEGDVAFALTTAHDPRPAIVGHLYRTEAGGWLPEAG